MKNTKKLGLSVASFGVATMCLVGGTFAWYVVSNTGTATISGTTAKVDGELALVMDNIELNSKYQYNDKIRDAFMEYAKKICEEVGKPDLPIYAGPYRHKLNMTPYKTDTHDLTIIGSTDGQHIWTLLLESM